MEVVDWLVREVLLYIHICCLSFMSLQYLRSYQDGYQIVTVHSCNFIVLPHLEVRPLEQNPDTELTSSYPIY